MFTSNILSQILDPATSLHVDHKYKIRTGM
jgi:hypothetical protein